MSQIFSPSAQTAIINCFWFTYFKYKIQWYSPLTPATLNKSPPSAVKWVLEGQANADTVHCFYWPNEKPLRVSRGLELRLGSLLSAFISVSFTISLSLSPSLSLLLPPTPPSLTPSLSRHCSFPLRSWKRKCHQIKLAGASNTACLPLSIPPSDSVSHGSFCKFASKLYIPQVWYSMTMLIIFFS